MESAGRATSAAAAYACACAARRGGFALHCLRLAPLEANDDAGSLGRIATARARETNADEEGRPGRRPGFASSSAVRMLYL